MVSLAKLMNFRGLGKQSLSIHPIALASTTAAIALMGVVTSTSEAQAATFDLTFTGDSTSTTGTGTVTIDDSLLIPNQSLIDFTTGITAFQANLTNIPSIPTSTTFNLADVSGFLLTTDASANIVDFNIFSAANGDAFTVSGLASFVFSLSNDSSPVDLVVIGLTPAEEPEEPTTTPEPGTLLGLLAVGSIGALTRKRKA